MQRAKNSILAVSLAAAGAECRLREAFAFLAATQAEAKSKTARKRSKAGKEKTQEKLLTHENERKPLLPVKITDFGIAKQA